MCSTDLEAAICESMHKYVQCTMSLSVFWCDKFKVTSFILGLVRGKSDKFELVIPERQGPKKVPTSYYLVQYIPGMNKMIHFATEWHDE